jgi:Ca-activated chloride channel family protein
LSKGSWAQRLADGKNDRLFEQAKKSASTLYQNPIQAELSATTDAFRFSAAVAAFGMKLRGSSSNKALDWPGIKELAAGALGEDAFDYRAELLELVTIAEGL